MKNKLKLAILPLIIMISPYVIKAKTNFSLSLGYDINKYEKKITTTIGSYLYREDGKYFLSIIGKEHLQVNWLYDIDIYIPKSKERTDIAQEDIIGFYNAFNNVLIEGFVHSIPLTVTIYWEAFKKFRYGFGANISMNIVGKLNILGEPMSKDVITKNMAFIRKILKSHLTEKNIEKFKSIIIDEMPEEYFWQIETIYQGLDDTKDKDEKEKLKEIMDKYSQNTKVREKSNPGSLTEYIPLKKINYTIDPFILLGFKFIENTSMSALIDVTISPIIIAVNSLTNFYMIDMIGPPQMIGAYSLGLTMEKHVSEYYRVFGRLAYKSYDSLDIPKAVIPIYFTEMWSISLQIGISFESPEMERCVADKCGIQVKHRHNSKTYRGSDMFTGEDFMGRKLFTK